MTYLYMLYYCTYIYYVHRVEIINVADEGQGSGSENVGDVVHPSNMEVSSYCMPLLEND